MALSELLPWKRNGKHLPVRREPERLALTLRDEVNRLFDEFFSRPFDLLNPWESLWESAGVFTPRVDVKETDREVVITAELPGLDERDVQVTLSGNLLTIRGQKKSEVEEQGQNYYRVERSFGSFHRSIPIPVEVDENKIDAVLKKGVLTVTLPKTREAQQRRRLIPIKRS